MSKKLESVDSRTVITLLEGAEPSLLRDYPKGHFFMLHNGHTVYQRVGYEALECGECKDPNCHNSVHHSKIRVSNLSNGNVYCYDGDKPIIKLKGELRFSRVD